MRATMASVVSPATSPVLRTRRSIARRSGADRARTPRDHPCDRHRAPHWRRGRTLLPGSPPTAGLRHALRAARDRAPWGRLRRRRSSPWRRCRRARRPAAATSARARAECGWPPRRGCSRSSSACRSRLRPRRVWRQRLERFVEILRRDALADGAVEIAGELSIVLSGGHRSASFDTSVRISSVEPRTPSMVCCKRSPSSFKPSISRPSRRFPSFSVAIWTVAPVPAVRPSARRLSRPATSFTRRSSKAFLTPSTRLATPSRSR